MAGGPDPSKFFRPLAGQEPPEEFWAGFWPSVRAGIREAQLRPPDFLTRGRALLLGLLRSTGRLLIGKSGGPGEGGFLAGVGAFPEVEVDPVLVRNAGLLGWSLGVYTATSEKGQPAGPRP